MQAPKPLFVFMLAAFLVLVLLVGAEVRLEQVSCPPRARVAPTSHDAVLLPRFYS